MSSELETRSEVGVILDRAPKLEKAFGKWLGAILTWKALSAIRPRSILTAFAISIISAAAAVFWPR